MSERPPHVLVADMLEAVGRVLVYTAGMTYAQFCADPKTIDAVLRNLQVLGEAANRVPEAVRAQAPEVEWTRIIRSRHVVVHEYFGVDREIVWRIVEAHLPPLRTALAALLERLRAGEQGP